MVQLKFWPFDLALAHRWAIANRQGSNTHHVVFAELTDGQELSGIGEGAPSRVYGETADTAMEFLKQVDGNKLSFDDIAGSMHYLESITPTQTAARCALNLALLDGAAKKAGKPLYDFLGVGFREECHVTSFSIGIDTPDVIKKKVVEAEDYPVPKLKVGDVNDKQNLGALREVVPQKAVRVDANEGWKTKEQALQMIEWLAQDGHIQFIEQPMPRDTETKDLVWLKERSPVPLFADESYHTAKDIERCSECFDGVNVKLVKTGGVSTAFDALQAARKAGLKTMIGCMIESSVLISAAAHLAELADYLDIDGNLLITNDPYAGVTAKYGLISFAETVEKIGLRVSARNT